MASKLAVFPAPTLDHVLAPQNLLRRLERWVEQRQVRRIAQRTQDVIETFDMTRKIT